MELFTNLGVDWRLLVAQLINFIIILLVLNRFLYRPILNILKERDAQVKKSISDSIKIEEELLRIAKEREQKLIEANQEASSIIKKSQQTGELERQEIVLVAEKEAENIINKAKLRSKNESAKIRQDIVDDLSDIIVSVTEKILAKKITKKSDQAMIKETIQSLLVK